MKRIILAVTAILTTSLAIGTTAHADPPLQSVPAQALLCPAGGLPTYGLLINGDYVFFGPGLSRLESIGINEPIAEGGGIYFQTLTGEPNANRRITSYFGIFTNGLPFQYESWPGGNYDQEPYDLSIGNVSGGFPAWAQHNAWLYVNVCVEIGTPPPFPDEPDPCDSVEPPEYCDD